MTEQKKERNWEGRIQFETKSHNMPEQRQFFIDIEEAVLAGYRMARNPDWQDVCTIAFNMTNVGKVTMYKDGVEFIEPDEESQDESTESTSEENAETGQQQEEQRKQESSESVDEETTEDSSEEVEDEETSEDVQEEQKEEVTEEKSSVDLSGLEKLTKKAEVIAFAKDNGLEFPEDLKHPNQIKKHLKETYQ